MDTTGCTPETWHDKHASKNRRNYRPSRESDISDYTSISFGLSMINFDLNHVVTRLSRDG